jgi:hypothetical protein
LIGLFFTLNFEYGLQSISYLFFGFNFIFVLQKFTSSIGNKWIYYFSTAIIFSHFLSICVAFWELLTFQHLPSQYTKMLPDYAQFSLSTLAFSGNPNNFSYFLILSSFFLFFLIDSSKRIIRFYIIISLLFFNPIIIFLNESRLGLFVYVLLIIYFFIKKHELMNKKLIFIFLIVIAFIIFKFDLSNFSDGIDVSSHILKLDTFEEDSSMIRIRHFFNFIYFSVSTFGFGLGPGQYISYANNIPFFVEIRNPHNLFLEIGFDYGVYILAIFLYFLFNRIIIGIKRNNINLIYALVFTILSPVSSSYLDDPVFWMFLFVLLSGFPSKLNLAS